MEQIDFQNKAKQAAAEKALHFIQEGMKVGLGTGTTSERFIHLLGKAYQSGLRISALSSSIKSQKIAASYGIPLLDEKEVELLDIAVDGADEVGTDLTLIKGGGGALLREKIVAGMAKQMIVIVDENKMVEKLGAFPLPVEISPFAAEATLRHLKEQGFKPRLRDFVTDNGLWIADLALDKPIDNPQQLDHKLKSIPGILETGLFIGLASRVIVGHPDGTATMIEG